MSDENLPEDDLEGVRDNEIQSGQNSGNASSLEPNAVSGEEDAPQEATSVPTLEEAAADVNADEARRAEEADASGDPATFGESPLSQFDPDDLEH